MKKDGLRSFLLLATIVVFRLPAQDSVGLTQADNTNKLTAMIIAKQDEALSKDYHDLDVARELRELYLLYFRTEESLSFDKDTFANGKFRKFTNYISTDDGAIKVFSWDTLFGRSSHLDSLIQFRVSDGQLKTASIPSMIGESHNLESYFYPLGFFYETYKLKENIYLLVGDGPGFRGSTVHFVTLEHKEDVVVPFYAFKDNKMAVEAHLPVSIDLNYLPDSFDIRVVPEGNSFAIELDMLFPRDPVNMFKYVSDRMVIKEEDTFERRERFVFNGMVFIGNYWVLLEYWMSGERPVDISQFFSEKDFQENTKQQNHDESNNETYAEAENTFNNIDPSKQEPDKLKNTNNYFLLLFIPLCSAIVICSIHFLKRLQGRKKTSLCEPVIKWNLSKNRGSSNERR